MTRYERIRQEIVAVEKELAVFHHDIKKKNELNTFKKICLQGEQIQNRFPGIRPTI